MMLDNDVLKTYREQAELIGKGYQTLINDTLRAQAGLRTTPSIADGALEAQKMAGQALSVVADSKGILGSSIQSMVNSGIASVSQEDLKQLAGVAASIDYKQALGGIDPGDVINRISAIDGTLQAVKKAMEPLEELKKALAPLDDLRRASKIWDD